MRITVLAFAAARDAIGRAQLEFECAGATPAVGEVLAQLAELYPGLRDQLPVLRVAVNEEFATAETRVAAGQTLALLPPMSGG
jgi:molybdopterin converting factor subunit 1